MKIIKCDLFFQVTKLSRVELMFSFLHVHCKFFARGQSVHYGLFHSPFLLIHNIYPQFLIMISFRFCLENILCFFFCFSFLSVCERVEWLRVHIAKKKEKKLKFKVSLESEHNSNIAPANHPFVIDILIVGAVLFYFWVSSFFSALDWHWKLF